MRGTRETGHSAGTPKAPTRQLKSNSAATKTTANPQAAHRRPPPGPGSAPQDAPAASEKVAKLDQDETRTARAPSTGVTHRRPPPARAAERAPTHPPGPTQ
jgi:hypothetical protein